MCGEFFCTLPPSTPEMKNNKNIILAVCVVWPCTGSSFLEPTAACSPMLTAFFILLFQLHFLAVVPRDGALLCASSNPRCTVDQIMYGIVHRMDEYHYFPPFITLVRFGPQKRALGWSRWGHGEYVKLVRSCKCKGKLRCLFLLRCCGTARGCILCDRPFSLSQSAAPNPPPCCLLVSTVRVPYRTVPLLPPNYHAWLFLTRLHSLLPRLLFLLDIIRVCYNAIILLFSFSVLNKGHSSFFLSLWPLKYTEHLSIFCDNKRNDDSLIQSLTAYEVPYIRNNQKQPILRPFPFPSSATLLSDVLILFFSLVFFHFQKVLVRNTFQYYAKRPPPPPLLPCNQS